YAHYIYLVPASSFSKIVWSNLEIVCKVLVESLFIFGVVCAITGEHPLVAVFCGLVYTLFSLLLLGVNYLSLRLTGADLSAGLLVFIYIVAVVLIMLPGIALAFVTGVFLVSAFLSAPAPLGLLAGLAVLAVWELAAALVCFALSRSALHNCDMPVIKPRGQ
ncbi:MAG: putative ABC exporter domain-containing protein, partial [Clostridiales Family XIII bacterium]|nr:putative ABC exporter domain-containing protein [Clostridiales Family XIII bacterium]